MSRESDQLNRRKFIQTVSTAALASGLVVPTYLTASPNNGKPAVLGGPKAHPGVFPGWPIVAQVEKTGLMTALESKRWGRLGAGSTVGKFEEEYSRELGVKHALGVNSGTSALYTILGALGIGPGDEVIIPVYTFIATYNVVALNYALPIMIDTDPESFQIDASKIERAITKKTKAIIPVHIAGSPADLDKILAIGKKYNIPVIEDACQAHLAEWKGKKVGSYGIAGAFSFQSSKNLNSGEGGAITTNDETFASACFDFHNQGRGGVVSGYSSGDSSGTRGSNLRMTEFQGSILRAQMTRVKEQTQHRWENAVYLSKMLNEIDGITPAKLHDGTTMSAYHLYMFRYDAKKFAGLSRDKFLKALSAEGIPNSPGYGQMNNEEYVLGLPKNRHYLNIYGEKRMKDWVEQNHCPQNDYLTKNESVWFTQTMLLGTRQEMEQIVEGVKKIQKHAAQIAKS
jgi:perosamine synthetase